ncbi:MYND-type domain-containing protein [Mycena indigotica]|uniref:MYND-type domain-containing protein n=1 Tax=Mycena indigotica TaxID=2126181 RepID=A0A8H6RZK0_9AGAR|nr:MYND-type domain-containing protein [Mycena indigotica]KAF7290209.1 MYND-type domain-containing protein [Mycena indigotica]
MSRAMQMKFTTASKGDSYDKMTHCNNCLIEPPKGRPFMRCAACKEASFCSKECQKEAWPTHKGFCQMRKNTVASMAHVPSSPNFPPFAIRKRLLTDFIEVHECSFQSSWYSAIHTAGGMDSFPYDSRGLRIYLKYNPACQENPAIAYTLLAHEWFDDAADRAALMAKGFAGLEEQMKRVFAGRPGFRGWFRVYFRIEDHQVQESYPQEHALDPMGLTLERINAQRKHHPQWFERVQKVVADGLVKRALNENDAVMRMGRMRLKKDKWVWEPLSDRELEASGQPKDLLF